MFLKDFLSVWGFSVHSLGSIFWGTKVDFDEVQFIEFLFLKMVLLVPCLCLTQGHKYFLLCFLLKVLQVLNLGTQLILS